MPPMTSSTGERPATFAPPQIKAEQRPEGRLLIRSTEPRQHAVSVVHDFRAHSEAHPDRLLVAERGADGGWARSTWGESVSRPTGSRRDCSTGAWPTGRS